MKKLLLALTLAAGSSGCAMDYTPDITQMVTGGVKVTAKLAYRGECWYTASWSIPGGVTREVEFKADCKGADVGDTLVLPLPRVKNHSASGEE